MLSLRSLLLYKPPRRRLRTVPPAVTNFSAITVSLMFSLTTGVEVSRTEGTSALPLLMSSVVSLVFDFTGFAKRDRHFGGDFRLRDDRLENGHELFAGEDALQPRDGRVLTGDRPFFRIDAGAFHCRDGAAAGFVVGRVDGGEAFLPRAVIAWSASFWAFSAVQPGVSYSLAISTPSFSNTLFEPSLNRAAFGSAGSPLILMIGPFGLPISFSFSTSVSACCSPTRSLSNET